MFVTHPDHSMKSLLELVGKVASVSPCNAN